MSGYDPQRGHRRPRPTPGERAPVDALLADVPEVPAEPVEEAAAPTADRVPVIAAPSERGRRAVAVLVSLATAAVVLAVLRKRRARLQ